MVAQQPSKLLERVQIPSSAHLLEHMRRIGLILSVCMLAVCSRTPSSSQTFCSVGTEELNTAFDTWGKMAQENGLPRPVHEGRGNLLAPRALLESRCTMGAASMPMSDADMDALRKKFGQPPLAIPVALDAVAVIAHPSVETRALSVEHLAVIFHSTPPTWPEGFPGRGEMRVFGLNSASDLYLFFKVKGLTGQRVSDRVVEMSGPLSLVDKVASTSGSVGYARPIHADARVKVLALRGSANASVEPDITSIQSGAYPLSRFLYIYIRSDRLDQTTRAFLELVLSEKGQEILRHFGFYPLGEKDRTAALNAVRKVPEALSR